jgi:DNA-binding FadR family transcriptional regulator
VKEDPGSGEYSLVRQQLGRNLTFGLHESLGRAIITGRYRDAPFPTEAELAKRYDVSRSVTREAVKMLGAKGLLAARPKQGTFIQPEDQWNLFDTDVLRWMLDRPSSVELLRRFTELRISVEPQAAALAAQRASVAQNEAISDGLRQMMRAEEGLGEPLEADIAFHVAVLRASDNPFFIQFREVVATALRTSIRFTNKIAGRSASIADHAAVRDAIAARDPEGARAAMHRLIDDVLHLIETVEGEGDPAAG